MKQILILAALVGLLMGLGGAVGIVVVRERQAQAATLLPDSLAADSLAAADSVMLPADSAGAAGAVVPPPVALDTVQADTLRAAAMVDTAAAAPPVATAGKPAAEPALDAKRLAKLYGTMKPKDAARVLVQMQDEEIQTILGSLRDRQAAEILGNLPPERAAAISRTVIGGAKN